MNQQSPEESYLHAKLLTNTATLSEGLRYCALVTERGEPFPLDWEERILNLALGEEPERHDLRKRLATVLNMQGKPLPAGLDVPSEESLERTMDHQAEAARYNAKCGTADMEGAFLQLYEQCRSCSMTSLERLYALYKAIEYIENAGISGDIAECGVWLGGSMMLAASTLMARQSRSRALHLFDTFEGLPRPDETKDVDLWGNNAMDGWAPRRIDEEGSHWARATYDEVSANMASTGYPTEQVLLIKGMVEHTLPANAPKSLALLRLDTDWYASTKHELEHLYPLLAPGGVLIIDDYGHFVGVREAVDEYMASLPQPMLLMRVDYTCRMGVKVWP
jgi:O-methyltransferase